MTRSQVAVRRSKRIGGQNRMTVRAGVPAQLMSMAVDVLGNARDALLWLETPAIALGQRRPIDLLSEPTGKSEIELLLERMKHGVYV